MAGRRVSETTQIIEEPDGSQSIREEIFEPESMNGTSGTKNYQDESGSYLPRSSTPDNPF